MQRNYYSLLIQRFIRPLKFSCMSASSGKRKVKNPRISKVSLPTVPLVQKKRKFAEFVENPIIMDKAEGEKKSCIGKVVYLANPVKSQNDKKEYRTLLLPNGMRVLLISDPNISETEPDLDSSKGVDNMAYSSAEEEESEAEGSDEEGENDDCGEEEDGSEGETDEESEPDPDSTESNGRDSGLTRKSKQLSKDGERMAAAALCVNIGSFSDPPDLPGLAHFLEHMVFMGSKKYPIENAFDEFLKTYGGSSNASTDYETTTFEFEIHQRYFHQALAIFAEFFASPLLLPCSMKREKEAIDSEFQMALPSDSCRKQQLFASLAKDGHPMTNFTWGNSSTLNLAGDPEGVKLNQRLRLFWQEHYTADRMTLVLQSKHDLNQLEEWATSIFQGIPSISDQPAIPPSFKELGFPFDTLRFKRVIKIVPVKDVHQLCLSWALPSQLEHYRVKPLGYISWLIGHEGRGSLLAYLRQKVWALDLASGNDESGSDHNSTYALFSINISLTERGMAEIEQVIGAVFQYINMLKIQGPDERIWREIQTIEDLSFRYAEDSPPVENVEALSEHMHKYSPVDYITGDTLVFDFYPDVISKCINALQMDNVNIMILSKDFESLNICNQVEPWFQTRYEAKDIPDEWKQKWSKIVEEESPFAIPDPNPFLASDFSLLEPPSATTVSSVPAKVDCFESGFFLWYRPDSKFRIPKAVLNFYLVTPIAVDSARNAVLLELLAKMLKHQLMEKVYDALVAQLELAIHHYDRGLVIKVSGFNHKLHLLISAVVEQFVKFEQNVVVEVFDALRGQQEKAYRNFCIKPTKLVTDARLALLHTTHWSILEKSEAVKSLTLNDLKLFSTRLKESFDLKCLVQGNYSKEQALEVALDFKTKLQEKGRLDDHALPPIRICQVPLGNKYCRIASFHPSDFNSVAVSYYQVGPTNMRQTAVMEILVNLMEEPVFDILRTREQLGYNVYATLRNTFGVLGFSITVDFQADKFSASHVDERIEAFLNQFNLNLKAMTEDDLQTRVQSLIKLKQVPDVSLDEEVSRNWNEILSEEYLFDRLQQEIEQLPLVSLDEIRSFFQQYGLAFKGSERRKLSVQVIGNSKQNEDHSLEEDSKTKLRFLAEDGKEVDFIHDLSELRRTSVIFPPLKTFNGLPPTANV